MIPQWKLELGRTQLNDLHCKLIVWFLRNANFFITDRKTAQKVKFSIKDLFSKCDQIWTFLRIWSHLLKKSLMENFIFCEVKDLSSKWALKNRNTMIAFFVLNLTKITNF